MSMKRMWLSVLCAAAGWLGTLRAAEYAWMAEPENGEWSTSQPNWNAGESWPETDGHTAVFGASTQQEITVSEALNLGALRFQADGYRVGGAALAFSGETPVIEVAPTEAVALLETPVLNDGLLAKTGAGVLRLGAAAYDGGTNVRDVAVTGGALQIEAGRTLCSTGVWSVAAGATVRQSGGTNLLKSGGDVFLIGQGGDAAQTARVEVTGGALLAPSAGTGVNAYFILGQDRDAWLRVADTGSVQAVVIEMNPELTPGRSATLQLDGGRLTVTRLTGTAGASGTVSRVLLNGGEIYAGGNNGAFISDMTEALVQTGGLVITVPSTWYYKTPQAFAHDPSLGETPDGGLTKRGTGNLYLQADSTYSGGTRIERGYIYVKADHALGAGPVEVGSVGADAALVGDTGSFTVTNTVTFGLDGSVCAVTNGEITLTDIAFVPGYEQIKAGGGKTDGTVRLAIDPASTTRVSNIFVYDRNDLVLDSGTVVRQTDPLPAVTTRVDVRAGSCLNVRDADIQMPDISYLILSGGEYWQEGGQALFPFVYAATNWPNSSQPELPARLVLDGGTLTFTAANLFSGSNRRGTETIVNGGTLKAKVLNLSKSVQQATVSHVVELNGGILEVEGISYNGGEGALEPATVRLNGGTLKGADTSAATNDFITASGLNLLSVYLGAGGFVCDTAGKDIFIRQPFVPDPGMGAAPDGGIVKKGAGCLTLVPRLVSAGPVTVEEGTLRLADAWLSGENVEVQAGGTLELYSGGLSNATVAVAAGGTLRLAQAAASAVIPNGSFETYAAGTFTTTVKHKYIPSGTGWTYSSGTTAGIQTNGSGFSSDTAYYTTNGGVTAFIKQGTISTTFDVERDGAYVLAFEQATRNGYSSWARNVNVRIDGVTVYTIRHNGVLHGFLPVEVAVSLTEGTHTLAFEGLYAAYENNNATVLIDAITLTGAAPVRFDAEATGGDFRQVEAETTLEAPNGSFETYDSTSFSGALHKYEPSGTGWTFSPTCGIQTNGSPFSDNPVYSTTNGGVTAFVKEGAIQTAFSVPRDGAYRLSFEQATRNGYSSWGRNVEVRIDGETVYTVQHNGELHGFRPVGIPLQLQAGTHTLSFVGLYSAYENAAAAVLIDAVKLTRNNIVRPQIESVLTLSSGSTVILDNTTSLYLEYITVDGVRLRGALRAGQSGGATVLGTGRVTTVSGGTILLMQ
jgi:autotransporter-associated beta strand protein